MSSSRPTAAAPAPKRNPALVILDLTVGILLAFVGLYLSFLLVVTESQFPAILQMCTGPAEGLRCNQSFLSTVTLAGIAITIFAGALTAGMVLVNALRKRPVWYWPLLGIIISVASFYAAAALAGLTSP